MNIRKRAFTVLSAILVLCIFSALVMAHGNLTFTHGNKAEPYAFGSTQSDRIESSMSILMNVSFNDGYPGYSRNAANENRSFCEVLSDYLGGHSGSTLCYYYVNGQLVHTSTAPFPFNF